MPDSFKYFYGPSTPTNVVATTPGIGTSEVTITWDESVARPHRTLVGYKVYKDGALADTILVGASPDERTFIDTGVTAGTHEYVIRAYDDLGRLSHPSETKRVFFYLVDFIMELTPIDQTSTNDIYCNGAFCVDWGDGTITCSEGGRLTGVAQGTGSPSTITVAGGPDVTRARLFSDTFTAVDMSTSDTITSLETFAYHLNNLETFTMDDMSNVTTMYGAFTSCDSLTSFSYTTNTTSALTNMREAFRACSSLTSMPALNTSGVTNFIFAWTDCTSLTSFPSINTSSGTIFTACWNNCSGLTSFPALNFSSAVTLTYTWQGCTGLTSFPSISLASCDDLLYTWHRCTGLTSFPSLDFSNVDDIQAAWKGCSNITSMPDVNCSNATNTDQVFRDCVDLVCVAGLDTTNVGGGGTAYQMFYNCPSLLHPTASEITSLETVPPGYDYSYGGC